MSNRYQDDLKRIVGVTDERGTVKEHDKKKSIAGGRGIVYFDAQGNSQTASGTAPTEKKDDDTGEDTTDEGSTQPGANETGGGSSGGGSNGGNKLDDTDLKPPTTDSSSAADSGSGITFVPDMNVGTTPAGTELVDCDTGDCIKVRYDGNFSSPEGWDNPDHSPIPEGYLQGYYWADINNAVALRASSAQEAGDLYAEYWGSVALNYPWVTIFESYSVVTEIIAPMVRYNALCTVNYYDSRNQGVVYTATTNRTIYRYACNTSTADYCTTVPYETEWPADKCTEVSYNAETGRFETHPKDTKVPAKFAGGVAVVPSLCDNRGHHISHYTQANGGLAVYDAETGVARFIDSSGTVTGYGDGAAITANQP